MFASILTKIFGSRNDRLLKKLQKNVDAINALESVYEALDDEALKAKTAEFRDRLEKGETLDDLLIDAFATVREASKRAVSYTHMTLTTRHQE